MLGILPKGIVGHTGSDGSSMESRIERYAKRKRSVAETIYYGHDQPHEIVKSLLANDGVHDRGRRRIIFTQAYHYVGLAIGSHRTHGNVCVIDYAECD